MLLTKVCLVKAMVFPVVMYGCESWAIKKAERQIDAFQLPSMGSHRVGHDWNDLAAAAASVVLEKTLESPLDSEEIQPVSPEGSEP